MTRNYILLLLSIMLTGCYSTFVQPKNADLAQIEIINDSDDTHTLLSTFEDGATCSGMQFFNIPKEMQFPTAASSSDLNARGTYTISVEGNKKFSLFFDGIKVRGNRARGRCKVITTFTPQKNNYYEYHFSTNDEKNLCIVNLVKRTVDSQGNKQLIQVPDFISREQIASIVNNGSACK